MKIIKWIWIWLKIEQRHLVSKVWSFSCQFGRPRPPSPPPRFAATKSWKSGKNSRMHQKRPILYNRLFKYWSFSLKLYTIRRRIACRIFWASWHVCYTRCSRVINEKPVENSSTKFRRPNGFWKGPFPWPLAIRSNCH